MKKKHTGGDITDPPRDQKKLTGDRGTMDLPDVEDIPGQNKQKEPLLPPGDITLSSADEEGEGVLDQDIAEGDVSAMEKQLLDQAFNPSYDTDLPVGGISLDARDNEGEKLEEGDLSQHLFGGDLDDDLIREEDEETDGEKNQQ